MLWASSVQMVVSAGQVLVAGNGLLGYDRIEDLVLAWLFDELAIEVLPY